MSSNTSSCYAAVTPPRVSSGRLVGLALATGFVLIWTSGYLVGDLGTSASPPLTLLFWRFLLATAVMGAIAFATRAPWPTRVRDWVRPAAAGVLLLDVQFTGIYVGLSLGVSAGLASVIVSASPLVIALAAVAFDGERLRPAGWVGLALGFAGVVAAVGTELSGGARTAGVVLVVVGLAGFVGGTLLQKHAPAAADLRTGTTIQIGAATIVAVPLAAATGGFALPLTPTAIGSVVWLAVVNSVGGLLLFFVLLRRRPGAGATSSLFLVPPVTALLAVPVLGQPLHLAALAGVALAAVGVGLVSRSERTIARGGVVRTGRGSRAGRGLRAGLERRSRAA
ncbi:DMT family transporter [Actinomycetospora atypica]|uniref:DMT family transporter n=1 Tax=Actinomycetospora atypica TaxID=1290095 RepID=A0ABV9YLR3_9PSEU